MAETFDPYHKWLGISPQNQPPNLYRLLALETFESDPEVIEAAANRQMAYIQSCATGPYLAHSQKLLNEISAARLCLLDPKEKANYDAGLRNTVPDAAAMQSARSIAEPSRGTDIPAAPPRRREPAKAPAPPPAPPRAGRSLPPRPGTTTTPLGASRIGSRKRVRRRRHVLAPVLLVVSLVGIMGGLGLAILYGRTHWNRPSSISLAQNDDGGSDARPVGAATVGQQSQGAGKTARIAAPGSALDQEPATQETVPGTTSVKATDADRATESHAADQGKSGPIADPPKGPQTPPNAAKVTDGATLLSAVEDAIKKGDYNTAEKTLWRYLNNPSTPDKPKAREMLDELRWASDDTIALENLDSMTDAAFSAFKKGRLKIAFTDVSPILMPLALETMRRNLPEAERRRKAGGDSGRAVAQAPASEPGTNPTTPPPQRAARTSPAADPAEFLRSKGLRRKWSTWIVTEEDRFSELMEKARSLQQQKRAAEKDLKELKGRLEIARRQLARDEQALKRAIEQEVPGGDADAKRQNLKDRIENGRDVVKQAEAEVQAQQPRIADDDKEFADTQSQARQLVGQIDERYRGLRTDPQISTALAELGQQLGPSDEFKKQRGQVGRVSSGKSAM